MDKKKLERYLKSFHRFRSGFHNFGITLFGGIGFVYGLVAMSFVLDSDKFPLQHSMLIYSARAFGFFIGTMLWLGFIGLVGNAILKNKDNFNNKKTKSKKIYSEALNDSQLNNPGGKTK